MKSVRFVCPLNGADGLCLVCKVRVPHRFELLAPENHKPVCPDHRVALVKEP